MLFPSMYLMTAEVRPGQHQVSATSVPRRGAVLLIVLVFLTIFATIGLAFMFYADSESQAAQAAREAVEPPPPYVDAEAAFTHFLLQLLYDCKDDESGVYSALRGHSLLRNMYGLNYDIDPVTNLAIMPAATGTANSTAFNGTGRLHYTHKNPILNGADDYNLINYTYFPQDGGILRDPERPGHRTIPLPPPLSNPPPLAKVKRKPFVGGFNPPYTACDLNCMALAAVKADGTVLMPSYFRDWTGFGTMAPSNSNWYSDNGDPSMKYKVLRPRPADHPAVLVGGVGGVTKPGFPAPLDAGGDVQNLKWGKGNDSMWIYTGAPVMTLPDGRMYTMLFAPLIMDLDSKINVNVAGNVFGADFDAAGNYTGNGGTIAAAVGKAGQPVTITTNTVLPVNLLSGEKVKIKGVQGFNAVNNSGNNGPNPYWQVLNVTGKNTFTLKSIGIVGTSTLLTGEWLLYAHDDTIQSAICPLTVVPPPPAPPPVYQPITITSTNALPWPVGTVTNVVISGVPGAPGFPTVNGPWQIKVTAPPGPGPSFTFTLTNSDTALYSGLNISPATPGTWVEGLGNFPGHAGNQGWGPWEINLAQLLGNNNPEWPNLFLGVLPNTTLPNTKNKSSVVGRYGSPPVGPSAGVMATFSNSVNLQQNQQPFFYANVDYRGSSKSWWSLPAGAANQWPKYPGGLSGYQNANNSDCTNHPSLFNVFNPTANGNRGFGVHEMDKLLRFGDIGTQGMVSDLYLLCPRIFGAANTTYRHKVTTISWENTQVALAPWLYQNNGTSYTMGGNTWATPKATGGNTGNGDLAFPMVPPAVPTGSGGEFTTDWRGAVNQIKIDLNKKLQPYQIQKLNAKSHHFPQQIVAGKLALTAAAKTQFVKAQSDRQNLALALFNVLVNVTGATNPATAGAGISQGEINALTYLAQLAVNIVDFIDDDDIITPFNWGATGKKPFQDALANVGNSGWVYGVEMPNVVINEAYAEMVNDSNSPATDFLVNVWAELLNPFNQDANLALGGDARLYMNSAKGSGYPVYKLLVTNPTNGHMRDASNSTGGPGGYAITNATNAAPIVIGTNSTAALMNGMVVTINGVVGNTAANGTWTIANVDYVANTFQLVGSNGAITPTNLANVLNTGLWNRVSTVGNEFQLTAGTTDLIHPNQGAFAANGPNNPGPQINPGPATNQGSNRGFYMVGPSVAITGAAGSPIVINTTSTAPLSNGMQLAISGVQGNTAANGNNWTIANVTANSFQLVGSNSNGAYTGGGSWNVPFPSTPGWAIKPPTATVGANGMQYQVPSGYISGTITDAKNPGAPNPAIVITTASTANLQSGTQLTIGGVLGNTKANGTWYINVLTATTFSLFSDAALTVPVVGNVAYTSGGSWLAPPYPTLVLQRLLCPFAPPDFNQASPTYNPYITVDYFENVTVNFDPQIMTSPGQLLFPPPSKYFITNHHSVGRKQPYAGDNKNVVPQKMRYTHQPQHTFFFQNYPTNNSNQGNANFAKDFQNWPPGVGNNGPAPAPLGYKAFDWLCHLDRALVSPMELLQVSEVRPHELTQVFAQGGTAHSQRVGQGTGWFDNNTRLYRFFEYVQTFPYKSDGGVTYAANIATTQTRLPGKVNLNTIWDKEIFHAICDPGNGNQFKLADVNAIWTAMLNLRDPPVNGVNQPSASSVPFRALSTGYSSGGDAIYPSGAGVQTTLLTASDGSAVTAKQRLFEVPVGNKAAHPMQQYELLTKMYNSVTTRSNVFAVFVTVGFFEVNQMTVPIPGSNPTQYYLYQSGLSGSPTVTKGAKGGTQIWLGQELGRLDNKQVRHRMFSVIDRSAAANNNNTGILNQTTTFNPHSNSSLIPYFTIIE